MRAKFRVAACVLALGGGAADAVAQAADGMYDRVAVVSGFETRGYEFDPGIGTKSIWQWNLPVAVVAPLGRSVSVDVATRYASATLETYAGPSETLSGFTDTQLRLLFTPARDRLVASVSLNLPTGQHTLAPTQFTVAGSIGSNYLSFPVPNFGTGFGMTGGLAYAQHAGAWNLGFSGSARYVGTYSPFAGDTVSYTPGVEGRFRIGADRLLGQSARVLLGFTVSTFSTDVYSGTTGIVGLSYAPGTRFITDLTFVRVLGRSTLSFTGWDIYRDAGTGTNGPNPDTQENVFNVELRLSDPLSSRLSIEPLVGYRQWNPADYLGGRLGSAGMLLRLVAGRSVSLNLTGRYEQGWIYDRSTGRADCTGYAASLFARIGR
ncbi:MAG TPA: hypothetical protein VLT79_10790 [Gemmatimonadales bacterium]|nr:hypothetical protein [Gemmatimonadales bacterium]